MNPHHAAVRVSHPSFVIGVDVDGVVADLLSEVLRIVNAQSERQFTEQDINRFDLPSILGSENWAVAHQGMAAPGFASSLLPYPGAIEGVEALRRVGRVVFVTSPFPSSPTWMYDRTQWLRHKLGAARGDVVHVMDKTLFSGHVLVEDAPMNLDAWTSTGRPAIRVVRPWNEGAPGLPASDWDAIAKAVSSIAQKVMAVSLA